MAGSTSPPTQPKPIKVSAAAGTDLRSALVLGYFAMSGAIFYIVDHHPAFLQSAPFIGLATMVLGPGGIGLISSFYFGGTKTGSDVMAQQSNVMTNASADTSAPTKAP